MVDNFMGRTHSSIQDGSKLVSPNTAASFQQMQEDAQSKTSMCIVSASQTNNKNISYYMSIVQQYFMY